MLSPAFMPEGKNLLRVFPILRPGESTLSVTVYRTPSRETGRRILVRDNSAIVFDSGDCFDLDNAMNALELWLAERQS